MQRRVIAFRSEWLEEEKHILFVCFADPFGGYSVAVFRGGVD